VFSTAAVLPEENLDDPSQSATPVVDIHKPACAWKALYSESGDLDVDTDTLRTPSLRRSRRKFLELNCLDLEPTLVSHVRDRLKRLSTTMTNSSRGTAALRKNFRFVGNVMQLLRSRACHIVNCRAFVALVAACIIANAACVGVEVELSSPQDAGSGFWYVVEVAFTLFFLGELVLRLVASQTFRGYIVDPWNVFDLVLVGVSCVASLLLQILADGRLGPIELAQAMEVVQAARVFRLFRLVRELRALVVGIVYAMKTLLWTWVLLALVIYFCGVLAVRTIGHPHRRDEDIDFYFGSVPRGMLTLLQVTTTDDWVTVAKECMQYEPWSVVFFLVYLYGTTFAVLNVVVAVIVENTLDQAGDQRKRFLERQEQKKKNACAGIFELFHKGDADGDGLLRRAEFKNLLHQEEIKVYLKDLGIDLRQAENLFSILDVDENEELDAEEFVGGLLKAIGLARAKEVLALECGSHRSEKQIHARLGEIEDDVTKKMDALESGLRDLRKNVRDVMQMVVAKENL